jgi:HSP20 family protein
LQPGQAAWGWKPELLIALPSDATVNRRHQDEERREQSPGSGRSFTLPEEVNQDKIEASSEDGVLKVTLPKKEEAKRVAVSKQSAVK